MSRLLERAKRDLEAELRLHSSAKSAPLILRPAIGESEEAFADKCRAARRSRRRLIAPVPHGFQLIAGVQAVEFGPKYFEVLDPASKARYVLMAGGRGSGKTVAVETELPLRMMSDYHRILAAREYQKSLRESSREGLARRIREMDLQGYFDLRESEIRCTSTSSEIIFGGLGINAESLLSLEGIDTVWIEQGEVISARSFELLVPTIRAKKSQIMVTWNPTDPVAPVEQLAASGRDDVKYIHTTFRDNPWWDDTALEAERQALQRTDADSYAHVYEGLPLKHSSAQVFFGKYIIDRFEPQPDWAGPYQGIDFGFAADPSVLTRAWIHDRKLFISHEAHGYGVDIVKLPALFDQVPDARRYVSRADSARPETISFLQQNGYRLVAPAAKWPNCAEDGIEYLRGAFDQIVIHERCTQTAIEAKLYSFKTDRMSGDVLPVLLDRHNHCWDSIRYALEPMIQRRGQVRFIHMDFMVR